MSVKALPNVSGQDRFNKPQFSRYTNNREVIVPEQLAQTLHQLHTDLSSNPQLDAETIDSLKVLAGDIQRVLERLRETRTDATPGSGADKNGAETLSSRVHALIDEFEVQHPQLTNTLAAIAELLADMGI